MAQLLIKGTKVAEVVGDTTSLIANTLYHTNGTQIISDDGGTVGLSANIQIPSLVGMIAAFAMSSPPTGWLACQGQTLDADTDTAYTPLWNAIGTTWGGTGSSSFLLPDLRGAFLRGSGSHGTVTRADGSAFVGQNTGNFEADTILRHRHSTQSWGDSGGSTPTNPTNGNAKPIRYQSIQVVRETSWGAPYTVRFTNPDIYNDTWTSPTATVTNGYGSLSSKNAGETQPFNAGVLYCIRWK